MEAQTDDHDTLEDRKNKKRRVKSMGKEEMGCESSDEKRMKHKESERNAARSYAEIHISHAIESAQSSGRYDEKMWDDISKELALCKDMLDPERYLSTYSDMEKVRKRSQKEYLVNLERFEAMQKNLWLYHKKIKYYFFAIGVGNFIHCAVLTLVNHQDPKQMEAYASFHTLRFHYEYFLVSLLNNSDLMRDVLKWMQDQREVIATFTKEERDIIHDYCNNEFQMYWNAFNTCISRHINLPQVTIDTAVNFAKIFQRDTLIIPRGMVLFEGQGKYELDIYEKLQNGSIKVGGKYTRDRPTSSSWVPNVALSFINQSPTVDESFAREMISNSSEREELAIKMDRYHNEGCLIILTVQNSLTKCILRCMMKDCIQEECEVIIQPCIKMVVTRIERNVHIPSLDIRRVARMNPMMKCDIVWADVYGTDMNSILKMKS